MTLSVKECISYGWKTFKARPWFFVLVVLVGVLIQFMGSTVEDNLDDMGTAFAVLGFVISTVLGLLYATGNTRVLLRAHEDVNAPGLRDLWQPETFWRFLGTTLLLWVIIGAGLILLIVPGIYLSLALGFSLYLVVDRRMGPVAAIKESWRLTKGQRWRLFLLLLAMVGINILGFLALLIGLFVTVPVTGLAMVHAYRTLAAGDAEPAAAPAPVDAPAPAEIAA